MTLPIELIPNTRPPQFKWRQTISTPIGSDRTVDHEGALPPSVEGVVAALISLAKHQAQEIVGLQRTIKNMAIQLDTQTESLKKAEVQSPAALPMNQSTGRRKG